MTAHVETFLAALDKSIQDNTLVKLTLGKYRGPDASLTKVMVRPVTLAQGERLSFVYRHATRDITKNLTPGEGLARVRALLGAEFRSAHLFTTMSNFELVHGKKGKTRLHLSAATQAEAPAKEHNRPRRRHVPLTAPYLAALGVTGKDGLVKKGMEAKYRQINQFIEIVDHLLARNTSGGALQVMDMGAGKGYLTFALYDYLTTTLKRPANVTGIETRQELVDHCNRVARDVGFTGLHFERGEIANAPQRPTDVLIALHACDTATDEALFQAVRSGAALVLCAPCCHKELRPGMGCAVPGLVDILKFGILEERQAELLTDGLRALLLEACGYRTKVFEFIATEHTSKNTMIAGVKAKPARARGVVLEQVAALKKAFGIKSMRLEALLGVGGTP